MADKPQISERPWSMWSSADYTLEQYAAACLVSPPADQLKSKIQCKLPIKTPDGVLNRAGVHAAAASLAGARGGVQLSPEERALAKKKLRAAYKKLNEEPPPSLAHALVAMIEALEEDAQQHGIKGMKWGVRRAVDSATGRVEQTGSTGLKPRMSSADQIAQDRIAAKIKAGGAKAVSNADIQAYTRRLQLQKDLDRVLAEQSAAEKAKADGFIKTFVKRQASRQVNRVIDKSLDVAVEAALNQAGIKVKKNNPLLGQGMQDVSKRLKPKKG